MTIDGKTTKPATFQDIVNLFTADLKKVHEGSTSLSDAQKDVERHWIERAAQEGR